MKEQVWMDGTGKGVGQGFLGPPGVPEGRNQHGRIHWIDFNLALLTYLLNSREGGWWDQAEGAGGKEQASDGRSAKLQGKGVTARQVSCHR